jgi:hypothetical protein
MVKVTLGDNLVSSLHPYVKGLPYSDLTFNVLLARRLIRIAQLYFQLKKGSAVFSGYIVEAPIGPFGLNVYERGIPIRSIPLVDVGFSGELRIEVEDFKIACGQDLLVGLKFAAPPLN